MAKPTHYLWTSQNDSPGTIEGEKEAYVRLGFRVVTFQDGEAKKDINEGVRALIRNHVREVP